MISGECTPRSDCSWPWSTLFRSSLIRVYTVCHSICIFWTHSCMAKPHCSNFRLTTAIFWVFKLFTFSWYHSYLYVYAYMSQLMRLWYLSHRQPAKAQASLRIRAVSPEPSLFDHMKYGSRRRVRPKIRHLAPLDGCACAFEECVYGGRKVP